MAEKVKYAKLSKPGLLATRYTSRPFTQIDIEKLTKGIKKYSLLIDGNFLYLYGE